MKLNMKSVLNISSALKTIMDSDEIKIDALLKFKFLGILKNIESHVDNFNLVREEKIREYGKVDDDGNCFISKDDSEKYDAFMGDIEGLLNNKVDVSFEKIDAKTLFELGINTNQLMQLYDIMEG